MNESKISDIESEEETLLNSDRYIRGLDAGIHALVQRTFKEIAEI
jgi:hypothetical protein